MNTILLYTFFPVISAIAGTTLALIKQPDKKVMSLVHHFTAGVVFAAAALEILPELKNQSPPAVLCGGTAGVLLMMLMQYAEKDGDKNAVAVFIAGIDIFIDGLILGLGFAEGNRTGYVLTLALTLEILFLGLSVVPEIRGLFRRRYMTLLTVTGLALLLPLGAILGHPVRQLGQFWLVFFLASGLIALLFLVTEGLLIQAHTEYRNTLSGTALFFAGFMLLLLLEEVL